MQIYDLTIELFHDYGEIWESKRIDEISWNFQINVKGSGATLEGSKAFISKIELFAPLAQRWLDDEEASNVDFTNSTLETPPWEISLRFYRQMRYDVKGDSINTYTNLYSLRNNIFP
jgi:hypothetical protein